MSVKTKNVVKMLLHHLFWVPSIKNTAKIKSTYMALLSTRITESIRVVIHATLSLRESKLIRLEPIGLFLRTLVEVRSIYNCPF